MSWSLKNVFYLFFEKFVMIELDDMTVVYFSQILALGIHICDVKKYGV